MANLSVQFINRSSGAASFLWSFGDGATSALENPTHVYALGGAYVVKLVAMGPGGQSQISKSVITVGNLEDVLLFSSGGDQLADAGGADIAVPPPL